MELVHIFSSVVFWLSLLWFVKQLKQHRYYQQLQPEPATVCPLDGESCFCKHENWLLVRYFLLAGIKCYHYKGSSNSNQNCLVILSWGTFKNDTHQGVNQWSQGGLRMSCKLSDILCLILHSKSPGLPDIQFWMVGSCIWGLIPGGGSEGPTLVRYHVIRKDRTQCGAFLFICFFLIYSIPFHMLNIRKLWIVYRTIRGLSVALNFAILWKMKRSRKKEN